MSRRDVQPLIYVDTNIFIAAFEGDKALGEQLQSVFSKLKRTPKAAVTSEITLAEVLGKESTFYPWAWQTRLYLDLLVFNKVVELRPVTRPILIETGDYRRACRQAGRKVGLLDSIHCVTAVNAGCRFVWTADKRFPVPTPLERVLPDFAGLATIDKTIDEILDD